jgi:hypothetical protein
MPTERTPTRQTTAPYSSAKPTRARRLRSGPGSTRKHQRTGRVGERTTPSTIELSRRGWKGSSSWRSTGRRRGWWTCGRRGQALDFLGYTFGWDRDRKGRDRRFLNVFRSKEGGSTGAGKAARDDEQSPVLQADSDSHWRAESAPEGMGELPLLWVPSRRATGRSTGTYVVV